MNNIGSFAINVVDLQEKKLKTTPIRKVDHVTIPKREKNYSVIPWRAIRDMRINKTAAYLVLSAMCGYTNRHGETWVGQQTIADTLGVSRQAIGKQIKRLIETGYLQVLQQPSQNSSTRYRVVFDASQTIEDIKANTPARLREDTPPEPPPLSKEESAARIKALKDRLKKGSLAQPQKLHQDSVQTQPPEVAPEPPSDATSEVAYPRNLEALLGQPKGHPEATTGGCPKGSRRYIRKGVKAIWKEKMKKEKCELSRAHEDAHERACATVDQFGIPDELMGAFLDRTISDCRARSIPVPTSMEFLARLGESGAWEQVLKAQS